MLNKLLLLCTVALIGCAAGRVGPRIGVDIPVSGINAEGDVTTTSGSVGFIGGASFEGLFNNTWGLRIDPQIRTMGGDVGFAGSNTVGAGIVSVVGTLETSATVLDIPGMVTFNPTDSGATINPFFCFGAMLSFATTTTSSASGTQTYTEDGQSASAPFAQRATNSGIGEPFLTLLFSGGVRIPMSASWEFRAEARLHQVLTDASFSNYTLYSSNYRELVSITTGAPSTSLGITVGMFIRL